MELRFDFTLKNHSAIIEFDGKQHYEYVPEFHGNDKTCGEIKLQEQKVRDEIKNEFCKNNNLKLLRIKYDQINKVDSLITDFLNINK